MDNNVAMSEFLSKFNQLSEHGKKYIMETQQVLLCAQDAKPLHSATAKNDHRETK